MKIFVHIGFNKCASTSFQHTLVNNKDKLQDKNYFFYPDDDYFCNNNNFFSLIKENKISQARELIKLDVEKLPNQDSTLIISCENLWYLLDQDQTLSSFLNLLREFSVSIEMLLITRKIEDLINSYIIQLISNGSSLSQIQIADLSLYFIQCLKKYSLIPIDKKMIMSLDSFKQGNSAISYFFENYFGVNDDSHLKLNKSRKEYFLLRFISSQLLFLESKLSNQEINHVAMDSKKAYYDLQLDKIWTNDETNEILKDFESIFKDKINQIILNSINNLSVDEKYFLRFFSSDPSLLIYL